MSWFDYLLETLTVLLCVGIMVVGTVCLLVDPTNYLANTLATALMLAAIWVLTGWVKEKTSTK